MFLIAGLGNPGEEYKNTRHNVGFLFLDYLADSLGVLFSQTKWQGTAVKTRFSGDQVLLLKPQTYMNKSGISVGGASMYYKISHKNIIIVHDEIDLPFGKIKIAVNRGPGGHNGIKSIINHLGDEDFIRVRVGIGRPDTPIPVDRYVLSRLNAEEKGELEKRYSLVVESLQLIISQGVNGAMNTIHAKQS
jgi:peptidyl-tRNA hydrolase, PTH1 family